MLYYICIEHYKNILMCTQITHKVFIVREVSQQD